MAVVPHVHLHSQPTEGGVIILILKKKIEYAVSTWNFFMGLGNLAMARLSVSQVLTLSQILIGVLL